MTAEIGFFWATIFLYSASLIAQMAGFAARRERVSLWGMRLLLVALAAHTGAAIARWESGGHVPLTDRYEANLAATWAATGIFLLFERMGKVPRAVGLALTPVVFLVLGHGILEWRAARPLAPAFQSPWLEVHVVFASAAFGSYAIATGAAVFLILKLRSPESPRLSGLPSPDRLDDTCYRFIVLGFIAHAVMLASGAIWARKLWGRYWSWDALETWSLLSFLMYAFYLHARAFLGWRMRTAAWLAALGLFVLSISFWGVEWLSPSALHPGS